MTLEEAKVIILNAGYADGVAAWVDGTPEYMRLDGSFDLEELQAIVTVMTLGKSVTQGVVEE